MKPSHDALRFRMQFLFRQARCQCQQFCIAIKIAPIEERLSRESAQWVEKNLNTPIKFRQHELRSPVESGQIIKNSGGHLGELYGMERQIIVLAVIKGIANGVPILQASNQTHFADAHCDS